MERGKIQNAEGLKDLLKALVQETIEGEDERETRGLEGARILPLSKAELISADPGFQVTMPDGRRFGVVVRENGAPGDAAS